MKITCPQEPQGHASRADLTPEPEGQASRADLTPVNT
jgi:hypothetical protein